VQRFPLTFLHVLSMQYHNIFALVKELGIPNPFTRWTPSGFWSPTGLTTQVHTSLQPLCNNNNNNNTDRTCL
jgi:hypothetical protein